MKRILMCIGLCMVLCSGVIAQSAADTPATKEDVEKYLSEIHAREMMQKMVQAMADPMHRMMHDQFLKMKEDYKVPDDFEARVDNVLDDMLAGFPWDELLQAMVPTYQKHFTKGDLEALTAFYSSPTGQKLLREMPAVTAETMDTIQPMITKHMDEVQARVEKEVAEMLKQYQPTSDQKHRAKQKR